MGSSRFPQHPLLNLTYADALKQQKMFSYADSLYRQFLNDPKFKTYALIGIGEVLSAQQKWEALKVHKKVLQQQIKINPLSPSDIKLLGKRLDDLIA